jgi:hypothetical protein
MKHRNDYSVITFLSTGEVKKWKFVHALKGFKSFLDHKHPSWMYMNIYNRRTGEFLKRIGKDQQVPDFL